MGYFWGVGSVWSEKKALIFILHFSFHLNFLFHVLLFIHFFVYYLEHLYK